MKKYNGRENVVKYFIFFHAFYIISLALMFIVYLFLDKFWFAALMVLLYCVCMRFVSIKLSEKYIMSVLNDEADAEKFREMVYGGGIFSRDGLSIMLSAFYNGDFQQTVDLCTEKLKDRKCQKYKYTYYSYLAAVYSIAGDKHELEHICDMFDADVEARADGNAIRARFPNFEYYRRMLQGDAEWCLEYMKKEVEKQKYDRLTEVIALSNYGRVLYIFGRAEEARPYLVQAAELAPRSFMGKLAAECVERIDGGLAFESATVKYIPNTGVEFPAKSRFKTLSAIVVVTVTVIFVVLMWVCFFQQLNL